MMKTKDNEYISEKGKKSDTSSQKSTPHFFIDVATNFSTGLEKQGDMKGYFRVDECRSIR